MKLGVMHTTTRSAAMSKVSCILDPLLEYRKHRGMGMATLESIHIVSQRFEGLPEASRYGSHATKRLSGSDNLSAHQSRTVDSNPSAGSLQRPIGTAGRCRQSPNSSPLSVTPGHSLAFIYPREWLRKVRTMMSVYRARSRVRGVCWCY